MMRKTHTRRGSIRLNFAAALIGSVAFVALCFSFQATPAGAGLDPRQTMLLVSMPGPGAGVVKTAAAAVPQAERQDQGKISPTELQQKIQAAVNSSRVALELYVTLLELGKQRLEQTPDYDATFFKQERLDGEEIQELQNLRVKLRHAPFSVYMKWLAGGDRGREVLYVDGQLDSRLLVQLGGVKGRLLKPLKLEPTGSLAMKESRHPITDMGLLNLTKKLITYRKRDLAQGKGVHWQLIPDQKCFDRDCLCFVVEYERAEFEPVYRKTLTYIDKELSVPVCVKNFTWPEAGSQLTEEKLDEATCIEFYGYKDLRFSIGLKDSDFDRTNEQYAFRK